jgi:hypothetical protein
MRTTRKTPGRAAAWHPEVVRAKVTREVVVAREEEAFIGAVFEGGLWTFDGGQEMLAAGVRIASAYNTRASVDPQLTRRGKAAWRTWRSRDGGVTWKGDAEVFACADAIGKLAQGAPGFGDERFDSRDEDVLLAANTLFHQGADVAVLHGSRDRGRSWQGPVWVQGLSPATGRSCGQSSTCLRGDGSMLIFLTSTHPGGRCRPCVIESADLAGRRSLLSYLPADRDFDRVYPAPAALPDGRIVVAVTQKPADSVGHTLLFISGDDGRSWEFLGRANDAGEPAHLLPLRDGRLALTYGLPLPPYRICARLSEDAGVTWGPERVLREGGGSADLGSLRSAQGPDGAVVTVYQWNNAGERGGYRGGRRYLAATHWHP